MIRGLYTAASGMVAQQRAQDVTSNNLANADTAGYKRDIPVHQAFPEMFLHRLHDNAWDASNFPGTNPAVGYMGTGSWVSQIDTVWEQGPLEDTGGDLDFAIEGDGFFVVDAPQGRRYTRDGSFHVSAEGLLVTQEGFPVLGVDDAPIEVDPEDLAGLEDAIRVETFPDDVHLEKEGHNLVEAEEEGELVEDPPVHRGMLERSNVNVVDGMVEMISGMRAYEANQRAVHAHDETLERAVNEVGRV